MIAFATNTLRVTILRAISVGATLGLAITGLLAEFDPGFVRVVVLVMTAISGVTAVAIFTVRNLPAGLIRSYVILLSGVIFVSALAIQPFGLGTLSGFVFLGIVVAVASYETRALAVGLGAMAIALGVTAILLRSSIPVPASVVFISIAVLCQISVLGYRGESSRAIRDAMHDPLTGLTNRRGMEIGVRLLSAVAHRGNQHLGCLVIDLDNFKSVNDRFGHPVGDQVLARTAQTLKDGTRNSDLLVRLGGEEFALFAQVRSAEELLDVAQALRASIELHPDSPSVTVSIGGSVSLENESSDVDAVIGRADAAMYLAKQAGRNRVILE